MTRSLSIVIPAYNEERRLPATLDRINAYLDAQKPAFAEIVVVNDGSRDGTAATAEGRPRVRVLHNPGNRGKGYSVRHGMLEAKGAWSLISDADLSAPIEELGKLFEAVERSSAKVAIGSRAIDRSLIGVHQPALREYAGRAFNVVMRLATGLPFRDTQCGFKLF
ncbi:MAG: dolichyl-phosphate beta-glucosyltransferase, partial [Bryobacteraceae bacterium]